MTEENNFGGLLRRLSGEGAKVLDNDGNLIGKGTLLYSGKEGEGLYLGKREIPLGAVRDVCPDCHGFKTLVFIDQNYKQTEAQLSN